MRETKQKRRRRLSEAWGPSRSCFKTESGSGLLSSSLTVQPRSQWRSVSSRFSLRTWFNSILWCRTSNIPWMSPFHKLRRKVSRKSKLFFFRERICERICQQGGVVELSKTSSQDRMLQRSMEQTLHESVFAVRWLPHERETLDEPCLPRERPQQRIAKQIDHSAQELDALLKHQSFLMVDIASLDRDAKYDKIVAEREWSDLVLLLENQLTEIDEQLVLLVRRDEASLPQPSAS